MKKTVKISLFGAFFVLASIGGYYNCHRPITDAYSAIKNKYMGYLVKKETAVWNGMSTLGLSKAKIQDMHKTYHDEDTGEIDASLTTINPRIRETVESVLTDFNIDPKTITLVKFDDQSPAAANENVIFINEKKFSKLPQPAQRFVIGHEIQHMIHQDDLNYMIITSLVDEKKHKKVNDPLNHYYRFTEERADILAATKNLDYAQGYVSFMKTIIKWDGENAGITHPKNSKRLELANSIVDKLEHGIA